MSNNIIGWAEDGDVVTLTINDPTQSVNTMNDAYLASVDAALARLTDMGDALAGVIITSGKPTFFAGVTSATSLRPSRRMPHN